MVLAAFQAAGVSRMLAVSGVALAPGMPFYVVTTITLVTGTLFLMWLGEQITERGIGNGISLIIFAGIIAGLPAAIGKTLEQAREGQLQVFALLIDCSSSCCSCRHLLYLLSEVNAASQ